MLQEFTNCSSMFGHKYEARYDTKESDSELASRVIKIGSLSDRSMIILTQTTYIHDICIRCGHTIKRNP